MTTTSILTTIASLIAGSAVAAVGVVGLVSSQVGAPAQSPTNANQPVVIDYGSN